MVTLKKRRVVLIELFFCCQNMHPLWFSLSRLWLRRRRLKLLVYRGCHKCAGGNHTSVFSQFFLSTFGQQFTIQRSRCSIVMGSGSKSQIQEKYQFLGSGTKTSRGFSSGFRVPESTSKILGSGRKEQLNFLNGKKSKYNFQRQQKKVL